MFFLYICICMYLYPCICMPVHVMVNAWGYARRTPLKLRLSVGLSVVWVECVLHSFRFKSKDFIFFKAPPPPTPGCQWARSWPTC